MKSEVASKPFLSGYELDRSPRSHLIDPSEDVMSVDKIPSTRFSTGIYIYNRTGRTKIGIETVDDE